MSRDSLVAVWPDKYAKGWDTDAPLDSVPHYPVMPLLQAFTLDYPTDAHFAPYALANADGTYPLTIPRVNKGVLVDPETGELADGRFLQMTALVFDVDDKEGGGVAREAWRVEQENLLEGLPDQWYFSRGYYETRGGYRLIWRLDAPLSPALWAGYHRSIHKRLQDLGIEPDDLKDPQRCYRLPSVRRDGKRSKVVVTDFYGLEMDTIDLSDVTPSSTGLGSVFDGISDIRAPIPLQDEIEEGERNMTLARVLGSFRWHGADRAMLLVYAHAHNDAFNVPPLEVAEVEKTVDSILRYGVGHRTPVDEDGEPVRLRLGSEAEIAMYVMQCLEDEGERLLVSDREQLWQYNPVTGVWERFLPQRMTRVVMDLDGTWILAGVNKVTGEEKFKPLKVSRALCANTYDLIEAQRHQEGFFDGQAPGLMFRNGLVTIDDAGQIKLNGPSPEWRQTSYMDMDWDPTATAPRFKKALREILDVDSGNLFGQWAGCAIMGRATQFEKAAILLGEGANGKSTLLRILSALIPPTATRSIAPQLMSNEYRRAALEGCRVNIVNELPSTEILESEQVKAIITGDPIDARHIRGAPFTFRPVAGHVFAANELPGVRDMSQGFWRRWLVIPFDRTFEEEEQDEYLAEKIVATELQGVVVWLVQQAAQAVKQGRLTVPQHSLDLREQWRHEADRVSLFVEERTEPSKDDTWTLSKVLHGVFASWCAQTGYASMNVTNFGKRLKRLNIPWKRSGDGIMYRITIKHGAHLTLISG